jgi:hypothetical protein
VTNIDPKNTSTPSRDASTGRDASKNPTPSTNVGGSSVGAKSAAPMGSTEAVGGAKRVESSPSTQQGGRSTTNGDMKRDDRAQGASFSGRTDAPSRDESTNDGTVGPSSKSNSNSDARGSNEALKCLVACVEQIVKEIPRGLAASWDGVNAQLAKAKAALGTNDRSTSSDRDAGDRSVAALASNKSKHSTDEDVAERNDSTQRPSSPAGR